MHDAIRNQLVGALEAEGAHVQPDLQWVIRRGARIRVSRFVTVAATTVALIAACIASVWVLVPDGRNPVPLPAASDEPPEVEEGRPVIEEMTEEQQAEVFAYRALAATEVMEPLGTHTYTWTYEDDTTLDGGTWSVGFAAADCAPRREDEGWSQTCRAVGGEDPQTGNPFGADTFVKVERTDRTWRVTGVEGRMPDDQRSALIGYELEQRREPSHWDLPAVGLWPHIDETTVETPPIWVGPIPTDAPGSVCELQPIDAEGRPVGDARIFYLEAPSKATDRAGWVRGTGFDPDPRIEDARADCRQYTGPGWEVASEPEIVGEPGVVLGATAEIVWRGHEGFTAPASCRATLVDETGEVVWEGGSHVVELWRPSELKDHPYEHVAVVHTRGTAIDAVDVGDFTCETL